MSMQQMMVAGGSQRISTTMTVGVNGAYTGFSDGGAVPACGSLGSASINGGGFLSFIGNYETGGTFVLIINSLSQDPGAGYVTDVLIDGVGANETLGSHTYSYSSSAAEWTWFGAMTLSVSSSYSLEIVS